MHIAFLDITTGYAADAPYQRPLGGTQAAVCHLGVELAKQNFAVTLVNQQFETIEFERVVNMPGGVLDDPFTLRTFNVIVFNGRWTEKLVKTLRSRTGAKFIGWMHEACFQSPYILPLSEFDGMVFVSEWQRALNAGLVPANTASRVIPNGVAPGFHGLFNGSILAAKPAPEVAVYAGSSKRGLLALPDIIPLIHAAHPDLRFEIYADAYFTQNADENRALHQRLCKLPNVDHVGPMSQHELPRHFKRATYFLSPNAYPETFCIAIAEAMAAGLRVISTQRAAIPETTHGFAALIPFPDTNNPNWLPDALPPQAYAAFANAEIAAWRGKKADEKEAALQAQIAYASTHYNWARHVEAWRDMLQSFSG